MQFPSQFYSISDDSLLDLSLWLRSSCWEPHLGDVMSTYFNDNKLTKMALSLDLRKKIWVCLKIPQLQPLQPWIMIINHWMQLLVHYFQTKPYDRPVDFMACRQKKNGYLLSQIQCFISRVLCRFAIFIEANLQKIAQKWQTNIETIHIS